MNFGGCFAPPLTDESLARYEVLAESAPQSIKDAMLALLKPIKIWWELPESSKEGTKHATGRGVMIPLEDDHIAAIDTEMPWRDELNAFGQRFDAIHPVEQKELRDAAFHLLWYANELYHDPNPTNEGARPEFGREPITNDKI
jgi:hypothetical protein